MTDNRFAFMIIWISLFSNISFGQSIQITSFKASNSIVDSTFNLHQKIVLNYKLTNISIDFEDKNNTSDFEYKLIGFNNNWKNIKQNKSVYFVNLLGGDYEFQVRNTHFPTKIASIKFHIEEAFWQQAWFIPAIIAYLLLIAGIIFYFFQLNKFRQQTRLQQVRNDISADLHDDIGSTLSNISFLTEIAKSRIKTKPEDVPMILDKILDDSKEMVQTMRGMIWTINPTNDNATDFFQKVENLMREMINPYTIKLSFDCVVPENQRLMLEIQRNLFLVFKEATHNVIKYAEAQNIKVTIRKEGSWLMIQMKDDGIGFNENEENEGNGLRNIKNRIEQLGGNFEIKSNEGVRIRMAIPLT